MTGGDGADIYNYSSSGGSDTIDNSSRDGETDELHFTNIATNRLSFSQSGNDLLIARTNSSTDRVRVLNWFTDPGNRINWISTTDDDFSADDIDHFIANGGGVFSLSSSLMSGGPGTLADTPLSRRQAIRPCPDLRVPWRSSTRVAMP